MYQLSGRQYAGRYSGSRLCKVRAYTEHLSLHVLLTQRMADMHVLGVHPRDMPARLSSACTLYLACRL
jgi:hypothetical protein